MSKTNTPQIEKEKHDESELRGLISGSALGAVAAVPMGWIADILGAVGFFPVEGIVRWIAGNSDTLGETFLALKQKRNKEKSSAAWIYVKGELLGTLVGPVILIAFHLLAKPMGFNPYGTQGVIIAAAFAHSDNLGGMLADYLRRKKDFGWLNGLKSIAKSPYQQGNAIFIGLAVFLSFRFRLGGFSPVENLWAGTEGFLMGASDSIGAGLYALAVYKLRNRKRKT